MSQNRTSAVTDQTLALDGLPPARRETVAPSAPPHTDERRGLFNRRLRNRRTPDNRINTRAPRQSTLALWSCWALSATSTVFVLILIAGEAVYQRQLYLPLAVAGSLVGLSVIAFMLGMIEQRLIEIRLELMMSNGGGRRNDRARASDANPNDRRQGDRRRADRVQA